MQTNRMILAAAAGFVGGLAVASIIAYARNGPLRAQVSNRFRYGREALDRGLRQVEEQLHEIDAALERTLQQFRDRAQGAGTSDERAGRKGADWNVGTGEVARELRHLPRR